MHNLSDTIAAIATGDASAALGIVRISGAKSAEILKCVVPSTATGLKSKRLRSGIARHPLSGETLDEVVCFYNRGPRTSTGEDTAEIQGHGGPVVMKRLLHAVLDAGARPAEPGEFTYRAFENGRMDLTQAEAVMSLIGARSDRAAKVAIRQLEGALGKEISSRFEALNVIAAHLEAGLDFPDEDLPLEIAERLAHRLQTTAEELRRLKGTFTLGSRLVEGATVAIVGPANAGKSSLFNRLVGDERAIVDPDPGTTRDMVEARGEIEGIPVVFQDTAGIRKSVSRVELIGIERSRAVIKHADLVVLVLDGASKSLPETAKEALGVVSSVTDLLLVLNKKDLSGWRDHGLPDELDSTTRVATSVLNGEGLPSLKKEMGRRLEREANEETAVLTTARQHHVICEALSHVDMAGRVLNEGGELELAAVELRWARDKMAGLLGRSATKDMLTALFSEFCIGK